MSDRLILVAIAALVGIAAACVWYLVSWATWTLDERKRAERRARRRWS